MKHGVILVLSNTVVCMEMDRGLSKTMGLKEVVEQRDNCVGSLPDINGFINEVVDLARNRFTTYPKDSALSWCQEVDGPWLQRVRWVVHLLRKVE